LRNHLWKIVAMLTCKLLVFVLFCFVLFCFVLFLGRIADGFDMGPPTRTSRGDVRPGFVPLSLLAG
jgi:hypothetical protein